MALFFAASFFFPARGVSAATVQYIYDELGRLTAVIDPTADVTEYVYDEVGNILSVSRRSASQVSIISFTPNRGLVGQAVAIIGTAFSPVPAQNQVKFNGTAAIVTAATATSLVTTVPLGATTGPISVTTPAGTATSSDAFSLREAPLIASFTPAIGEPGGTLSIAGRGFTEPGLSVIVNKTQAQVVSTTLSSFTGRIPSATGGKITVTNELGSATSADDLFIVPPPRSAADVAATGRIAIDGPGRVLALTEGKVGLLLFDGVAGASGIRVSLGNVILSGGTFSVFRPDGVPLASAVSFGSIGSNLALSSLPTTGTYGILVAADAGVGGNVTVTVSTGAANSLSIGETIVLSVPAANQTASFTFSGAAGDFLGLDFSNVSVSGATVQVLLPNGQPIGLGPQGVVFVQVPAGTGAGVRMQALPITGTYTVRVSGTSAGSAQVTLWRDVPDTVTFDTPLDVNFAFRNQQARLKFSGTAGQNLGVNISPLTLAVGGTVQVLQPNGQPIGLGFIGTVQEPFAAGTGAGIRMQALPVTGIYTVVIATTGGATGTARVTVWNELVGPLQEGVQTLQTVSFPQQALRFSFTGAIGDSLGLDLAEVNVTSGGVPRDVSVQVLLPNGQPIGLGPQGVVSVQVPTGVGAGIRMQALPVAGTYTVLVQPVAGATGTLKLALWRDVPTQLTIGTPFALTIPFRNQAARLPFVGALGDALAVELGSVTLPSGGTLQVLQANGQPLGLGAGFVSVTFTTAGGITNIQGLPAAGTYTVVISPSASGTGGATVRVFRR
jgi:YD repeat-containing protein